RDALVVEVGNFFAQVVILQQRWTTLTGLQRPVRVPHAGTLRRGQICLSLGARIVVCGSRCLPRCRAQCRRALIWFRGRGSVWDSLGWIVFWVVQWWID